VRIPGDPALPGLGPLLDAGAMTPLLARSLGRPARLDRVRIARVAYKPGERVSVHYRVWVDGRAEDAVARAVAERDLAARISRPGLLELARRVDGRSPAATPIVYEPDADALLTWLPLDPRLPALAEPPPQLAARLERAGLRAPTLPEPRRLSYKPGRRATLRVDGYVLKFYGSVRQYEAAATALQIGPKVLGLATPPFRALLSPLRATAQSAVDGAPVSSLPAAAEAGALVRGLQKAKTAWLEPAPCERQLAAATRKAALIAAVVPTLSGRVASLVRRLEQARPPDAQLVPAHGDFHPGQLLRVGANLVVLDLDGMCLGPRALDLAEYAAHAIDRAGAGLDTGCAVLDALVDGYGTRPDGLGWHLAAALLIRASHPFHRLVAAWPHRVESIVASAEAVLAGSSDAQ
jgi:hypothetical protein